MRKVIIAFIIGLAAFLIVFRVNSFLADNFLALQVTADIQPANADFLSGYSSSLACHSANEEKVRISLQLRQQLLCGNGRSVETNPALVDELDPITRWYWGHLLLTRGDEPGAIAQWQLITDSDVSLAHWAIALYFGTERTNREIETAIRFLDLADKVNDRVIPGKAQSYYAGYFIFREGLYQDRDRALDYAQRYAEARPSLLSHLILGRSYLSRQEFEKAVISLKQASSFAAAPDDRINFEMGRAWYGLQEWEQALAHLMMVSTAYISYPDARVNIARIYIETSRFDEAQAEINYIYSLGNTSSTQAANRLLQEIEGK